MGYSLTGVEERVLANLTRLGYYDSTMLSQFLTLKLNQAQYKLLKDGRYFGEIPGLKGVWADAKTLEQCREELREVLEEWLMIKLHSGESVRGLPVVRRARALHYA